MEPGEGAGETILDEIVGGPDVADQRAGIAPQARNLGFDIAVTGGHERLLAWLGPAPRSRNQSDPNVVADNAIPVASETT
jgi:hypothetical protein